MNFFQLDANGLLALATVGYAIGTLLLVWATLSNGSKTIAASGRANRDQLQATAENVRAQIESAHESARIQALTSSVSASRQSWINSVRDEVTGFLFEVTLSSVVQNMSGFDPVRGPQQLRLSEAIRRRIYKMELLINPTEPDSVELITLLEKYRNGMNDGNERELITKTGAILKREWERVKSGQ